MAGDNNEHVVTWTADSLASHLVMLVAFVTAAFFLVVAPHTALANDAVDVIPVYASLEELKGVRFCAVMEASLPSTLKTRSANSTSTITSRRPTASRPSPRIAPTCSPSTSPLRNTGCRSSTA